MIQKRNRQAFCRRFEWFSRGREKVVYLDRVLKMTTHQTICDQLIKKVRRLFRAQSIKFLSVLVLRNPCFAVWYLKCLDYMKMFKHY